MMRIAMTTPKVQIWKVLEEKQMALPYRHQFKPSNFIMSPIIDPENGLPTGVKEGELMLIAPSSDDLKKWYGRLYTNIHDGKQFNLVPLEKKKDFEASPYTLEHVVRMHTGHPESKSLAPDGGPCTFLSQGLLRRTPIAARGLPRFIGKETDRRWGQEDPSLFEPTIVEYRPNETARITTDAKLQNRIRSCGISIRELGRKAGLNASTIQNARNGNRIRKSSALKIEKAIRENEREQTEDQ